MKWKDAVRDALQRYCERHNTRDILLERLLSEEMLRIREDTGTQGETPDATLRREMQELRDLGLVEFVDDHGRYTYLGLLELRAAGSHPQRA